MQGTDFSRLIAAGCLWAMLLLVMGCGGSEAPEPSFSLPETRQGWPDVAGQEDVAAPDQDLVENDLSEADCVIDEDCAMWGDGDLCTGVLICVEGQCQLDPASVVACPAPEDTCLPSVCDPATGECVPTALDDGATCDDGNPCSTEDACYEGSCVGVAWKSCDDSNPCTADSCLEEDGSCVSEPVDVSCDDGNPCTTDDQCVNGVCQTGSGVLDCDDDNLCTDDACSSVSGCVHQFNQDACEDGDPCTLGDQCVGGECKTGPGSLDCDDNNLCTMESCVPFEGCQVEPDPLACDDGDPCTDNVCDLESGSCSMTMVTCDNLCLVPTAQGDSCGCLPKTCKDDDKCTVDSCVPQSGCQFKAKNCDDGDACTVDFCHEQSGTCKHDVVVCDDGNPCTVDTCQPAQGGCVHDGAPLNGASCSDGDDCTVGDVCAQGTCQSGTDACGEQECLSSGSLQCGVALSAAVPGEGAGNLNNYTCSDHNYPGIERVFTFVAPCSGQVSFTVSGGPFASESYDIFVLDPEQGCKPTSCIAAGLMSGDFFLQAKASFQAVQGTSYIVVVEGRDGAEGMFGLVSQCTCMWQG